MQLSNYVRITKVLIILMLVSLYQRASSRSNRGPSHYSSGARKDEIHHWRNPAQWMDLSFPNLEFLVSGA